MQIATYFVSTQYRISYFFYILVLSLFCSDVMSVWLTCTFVRWKAPYSCYEVVSMKQWIIVHKPCNATVLL